MITSTSNDRIKYVRSLVRDSKTRRKEGLFAVEGVRIASEIPKDALIEAFATEDFLGSGKAPGIFPYEVTPTVVSPDVFAKMSDTKSPQGILCICRMSSLTPEQFLGLESGVATAPATGDLKLLLLEGIQDPGNLGTMVRTAEGAGFDAIIADRNTVDVYNPKVTRSTMGSLFRVPVLYTDDLPKIIDTLKKLHVTVYAAHLNAETDYREENYPNRLAFLIGNEGSGLSEEISQKADRLIRIPMKGKLESLNAAVAAAILMYSNI